MSSCATLPLLALGLAGGSQVAAQHASPAVPKDERPPLFDDLGGHGHPITTQVPLAQRYFDQGLRLGYARNRGEAERAFREAARLDPKSAMAWWGVAWALGPDVSPPLDPERDKKALAAIRNAEARLAGATARERQYVVALKTRSSDAPGSDREELDRSFAKAMRELGRRFPDDLDAATLYAESLLDLRPGRLWNADGTPAEGTPEILDVLESVLRRDPNHPGANHDYVHAMEASPFPERALPSAERLRTLVPGAGHLVHTPAHIQMRTGDFAGAARSNALAAAVDEKYLAVTKERGVYWLTSYNHSIHFRAAAASMQGRSAEALKAADQLVANVGPRLLEMPIGEYFMPMGYYMALRFQQWDKVLAEKEPAPALPTLAALWRFARAVALAGKGDPKAAEAERKAFAEARAKVPADATLHRNPSLGVLEMAELTLDARLAAARGERGLAIGLWSRAVEQESRLVYDAPPIWYYPARESLGGELLRAGRFREAEAVFREDLRRNPRSGRSLFGLRNALFGQKRDDEAALVEREFEAAWKDADVKLRVEDL